MEKPKCYLEGFSKYFIAEDNQLYRQINDETTQLKKLCMKQYSKRYYFSSKFFVEKRL